MLSRTQSYRILIDLLSSSSSGIIKRGVGKLSYFWFNEILRFKNQREILAILGERQAPPPNLPLNKLVRLPVMPPWIGRRFWRGGDVDTLTDLAYTRFLAQFKADIIHLSFVYDGYWSCCPLPDRTLLSPSQILSATVYDVIPLIFPDHYLENEDYKKFYLYKSNWLQHADLLLAISETTRQDLIRLLGCQENKVAVIPPYIDKNIFFPHLATNGEIQERLHKYNLTGSFILYVGGDDFRKNIEGLIKSYAQLPEKIREFRQLAIVCYLPLYRKKELLALARHHGLKSNELILTGFVPEQDLPWLYSLCELFVFPSFYEGLGLPVLEAMACGAPVLVSDNSSLRELIDFQEARLNPNNQQNMTFTLNYALERSDFRKKLADFGKIKVKELTSRSVGESIIASFDQAIEIKHDATVRYVQSGGLPRRRLALLTPLPPEKSGIAVYSANFLPYLSQYFDIDIYTTCTKPDSAILATYKVYNISDFSKSAPSYDYILYEFGNSDYHIHMFDFIDQFPGVIVLHDAYLSGILYWIGRQYFIKELIYSHGPIARRIYKSQSRLTNPDETAIKNLPCTRRVLERSLGIISHSSFNLDICRYFYPEIIFDMFQIIPQPIINVPKSTKDEKQALKQILGFSPHDKIITSFGHIADTKCHDLLIDSFLASKSLKDDNTIKLIFVGQLPPGSYGELIRQKVASTDANGRIIITDFVDDTRYEQYLKISDIAVQLRRNSRGETSRGVLDALAHGIPTIINDYASNSSNFNNNQTIKISAELNINELSECLENCIYERINLNNFSEQGQLLIKQKHNPAAIAAQYAAAVNNFYSRHIVNDTSEIIKHFSYRVSKYSRSNNLPTKDQKNRQMIAEWLKSSHIHNGKRRQLFIDVSFTAQNNPSTGVSRTTRELVKRLYCLNRTGFEPIAVELLKGQLWPARTWLENLQLLLPCETENPLKPINFYPGDILLMIDSPWARYQYFFDVFNTAKANSSTIVTVIYDLLPLLLPDSDVIPGGRQCFLEWLNDAVNQSELLLAISPSVVNDLTEWINKNISSTSRPKIGWWPLGADFVPIETDKKAIRIDAEENKKLYLLMVGSIEPRKNHILALEAFEILWSNGSEFSLWIAGNPSSHLSEPIMVRLKGHKELGKRLQLFENPDDRTISELYLGAQGLLFPSKGEGFGLPLVEAAHFGTPIICSDLQVFHDIAGDNAFYVSIESAATLGTDLNHWLIQRKNGLVQDSSRISYLSWEESAERLLDALGLSGNKIESLQ
jgi:glycosyltransferase involved in cell wall biosynthesis